MKKNNLRLLLIVLSTIVWLFTIGCSKTYFTGFDPQSHFEFPNSNVIPLGKVTGEATRGAIFSFPSVTSDLVEEATQNALSKKPGADMLINSMKFQTRTDILFIHTLTYRIEGTAANMEIGTQKLK